MLEDLRRNAQTGQMKAEAAAPTTKTERVKLFEERRVSVKSSASIRGGGIESRGKTKGRFV
jgi:hypothetical protein